MYNIHYTLYNMEPSTTYKMGGGEKWSTHVFYNMISHVDNANWWITRWLEIDQIWPGPVSGCIIDWKITITSSKG